MKFGRFEQKGRVFFGTVEGEQVTELEGSIFESHKATTKKHALSALKTLVPCMPYNFYCAGLNYAAHVEWANKRTGSSLKLPQKADVGYRSPNALIATGESIVIPPDSPGPVQFEGELVAVIGKKARNLSEKDALSCVLGYTLGNDVSDRGWQKSDRTLWRAKNCVRLQRVVRKIVFLCVYRNISNRKECPVTVPLFHDYMTMMSFMTNKPKKRNKNCDTVCNYYSHGQKIKIIL